ncbi:MAG: FAD:protein FMN transferase [Scrofimicrobium sp.]
MSSPRSHSTAFPTMGTVATAAWSAPAPSAFQADAVAEELRARADELEALMSRFIPESEVSRLGSEWTEISIDTATVLRAAVHYAEATNGYFNPLLANQMHHWEEVASAGSNISLVGNHGVDPGATALSETINLGGDSVGDVDADGSRVPSPIGPHSLVPLVVEGLSPSGATGQSSFESGLVRDPDGSTVPSSAGPHSLVVVGESSPSAPTAAHPVLDSGAVEQDGLRFRLRGSDSGSVDFGAIAKGYAADKLRNILIGMDFTDALVSLGGSSIAVAGAPAEVGISSPWHGWDRIGTLTLEFGSMSMSADPNTRIQPGRQRSHVLDPRTGEPALTDLCGVIVCGVDGMACEAFSTAYLAMGLDEALVMDQEHPEIATLFLTVGGRMLADPRLRITTVKGLSAWLDAQRIAE